MLVVQVLQGMMEGIFLFLIASGLTLIFGVSRIVNFAHGSFYMIGAFLTYQIYPLIAPGTILGFFLTILLGGVLVAILGLLFELLLLRRIYHAEALMQLVLTLAAVLIIRDATKFIWGLDDVTVQLPDALAGAVIIGDTYLPTYQLVMVAVGVVVLAVVWGFLKFTRAGIILRAATDDRGMVALLGTNQAHVFSWVFAVGCFLAGIAGGFAAAFESINYLLDTRVIVLAFIVVVIGGLGNLYGALFAALAVGIVKALGLLWAPRLSMVIIFLLMAVVLLTRSLRRKAD
jgi:branched-chain amino acid transport system permease protein